MSGIYKNSVLGIIAAVLLLPAPARAVTQSVTAHIAFETPVALTKVSDIDFGAVASGTADTYTISPAGVVTAAASGAPVAGAPAAGNITVAGSATQAVAITAGNYIAQNGVSLQNATCAYDGGLAVPCSITNAAAGGAGKTLLVGVDAVVDGTQAPGTTAAPSFTVTVTYQ